MIASELKVSKAVLRHEKKRWVMKDWINRLKMVGVGGREQVWYAEGGRY
jgi:hypothetical protein